MVAAPLRGDQSTIADAIDAARQQFPTTEAYVEGDVRLTFEAWLDAADRLAGALVDLGVRPGDVVAIALPPSIDYAIAYPAIMLAGGVATGLSTRLGARELHAIYARATPVLTLFDPSVGYPALPEGSSVVQRSELARLTTGRPLGRDRPARSSTDPAVIIWTSGTTGVPKGAWFDQEGLRAAVTSGGVMIAPDDRRLLSTPFAHAGYMSKLWEQLAWGMTGVISPSPWTAEDTVRLLVEERITVAGGVPTQWAKIVEHPRLSTVAGTSLRLCISATAPAPPELVERVTTVLGCPLVVRYAMTECPSITGTDPGAPPEILFRTVGRPQHGVEVELREEDGAAVAPGTVGRVHVRSSLVMRGYWGDDRATAEALDADGWLCSGDLGRFDAHGNLVLVGRVSDMYIRGGYNVYPLEVENVLTEHPAVVQAAVVGVPAAVIGEIGVAFVVADGTVPTPQVDELRDWCRQRLTDYKTPDRVEFVDALPITPGLKIDKEALKQLVSSVRS
jgi:acyl-CoA synthetase (AMP-forming)/AMP-acid ligase II